MMTRSLVIVAALSLCATSARAAPLSMEECRAKYKAALAAKGIAGDSWVGFQEKQCGRKPEPPSRPKSKKEDAK